MARRSLKPTSAQCSPTDEGLTVTRMPNRRAFWLPSKPWKFYVLFSLPDLEVSDAYRDDRRCFGSTHGCPEWPRGSRHDMHIQGHRGSASDRRAGCQEITDTPGTAGGPGLVEGPVAACHHRRRCRDAGRGANLFFYVCGYAGVSVRAAHDELAEELPAGPTRNRLKTALQSSPLSGSPTVLRISPMAMNVSTARIVSPIIIALPQVTIGHDCRHAANAFRAQMLLR